jgi:hypothetical protein
VCRVTSKFFVSQLVRFNEGLRAKDYGVTWRVRGQTGLVYNVLLTAIVNEVGEIIACLNDQRVSVWLPRANLFIDSAWEEHFVAANDKI